MKGKEKEVSSVIGVCFSSFLFSLLNFNHISSTSSRLHPHLIHILETSTTSSQLHPHLRDFNHIKETTS